MASRTGRLLAESATRGERIISVARGAFCAIALVRFIAIEVAHESLTAERVAVFVLPYVVAIVASVAIFRRAESPLPRAWLFASVIVDAVMCTLALLPNVLFPWPTYPGVTRLPDLAIAYVIIFAAGLRLSTSVAIVGSAANIVGIIVLIIVDSRFESAPAQPLEDVSMVLLVAVGAASLAFLTAWRTTRLVERGALDSWRSSMAQQSLNFLLDEQHDTKSALTALRLQLDRLDSYANADIDGLKQAYEDLNASAVRAREHSFSTLAKMQRPSPVDLGRVVSDLVEVVALRFPGVEIRTRPSVVDAVHIAGGETVLHRVLHNLVVNACEGDGRTSARHVDLIFAHRSQRLEAQVADDGVGFDESTLAGPIRCTSSKAGGSGLGLFVSASIVEYFGGTLQRANRPAGGAVVTVSLPVVDATSGQACDAGD